MPGPNPEPLVSVFEHDPEMGEIVALFVAEMPERREELRRAVDTGDLNLAIRLAHQLKGAAGGYGFEALGDAAAGSERLLLVLREASTTSPDSLLVAATPLLEACGRVRLSTTWAAA